MPIKILSILVLVLISITGEVLAHEKIQTPQNNEVQKFIEGTYVSNQQKRISCIRALKTYLKNPNKKQIEKRLFDLSQDASWIIRGEAISLLRFTEPSPEITVILTNALADGHWFVRANAIEVAGSLKTTEVVSNLVKMFSKEDWDNQARIVSTLGSIGDAHSTQIIAKSFDSEYLVVRVSAYEAASNFNSKSMHKAVVNALSNNLTPLERALLISNVGQLKIQETQNILLNWRKDFPELDSNISLALYKLGNNNELENIMKYLMLYDERSRQELVQEWKDRKDQHSMELLLNFLANGNEAEHQVATAMLESLCESIPPLLLLESLKDADQLTTQCLVQILSKVSNKLLPELIVKRLQEKPPQLERKALFILLQKQDLKQTVQLLLNARYNNNKKVQPAIELALEHLGITPDNLVKSINDNTLPTTERVKYISWLGQLGDQDVVSDIVPFLNHTDRTFRIAAVNALKYLAPVSIEILIKTLENLDLETRTAAKQALAELGLTEEYITKNLTSKYWQVRIESLRFLGKLGYTNQRNLVTQLLEDPNNQVKQAAISTLGELKCKNTVQHLVRFLDSSDLALRVSAAKSLGQIGDDQAVLPLLTTLRTSTESDLSNQIINSLIELKKQEDITPILISAISDTNWKIRAQAAHMLNKISSSKALPILIKALDDQSAIVRYYARKALSSESSFSSELVQMAMSSNTQVRFNAGSVIASSKHHKYTEALIPYLTNEQPAKRAFTAYLLGNLKDEKILEKLLTLLKEEKRFTVRWWISYALGQIGDQIEESLLRLAKSKNEHIKVDGIRALGFLSLSNKSQTILFSALQDKNIQIQAVAEESIVRTQDKKAIPILTSLLISTNRKDLKKIVIEMMARLGIVGKNALANIATQTNYLNIRSLAIQALKDYPN